MTCQMQLSHRFARRPRANLCAHWLHETFHGRDGELVECVIPRRRRALRDPCQRIDLYTNTVYVWSTQFAPKWWRRMEKLLISADSHVFEPGDLWWKALGGRFGDAVPRALTSFDGQQGAFFYVGRSGEAAKMDELVDANAKDRRLEDLAQAGSDPVYRMKLMAADNVAAEVLNPTWGLWIPRISDPALRNACAEVYNDWILEYCSVNLKRLLPIAMMPITDVDWATKELERIVRRGARGIMIGTNPVDVDTRPYRDPYCDRFWAAAQESGLPVTLHIVTGRVRDP